MFRYAKLVALVFTFIGCAGIPALHAAWVTDGVAICAMTGLQDLPVVVSDGSGGAIVAWRDARVMNSDIYAQRVDADGNLLWPGTAMPVCTAPNSQSSPGIIADGSGGAIISWQDPRSGAVPGVYIQRINPDGYIQWQSQGTPLCTGQQGLLIGQTISDGSGGAIVAWHDRRNFYNNVFVQKIIANGTVQWTADGVGVSTVSCKQEYPVLASDGAGGVIAAWQDNRNGAYDIYAQRINAAGAVQWTTDGIAVCNSGNVQRYPRIIPDGSGGAIIAWDDRRNTIDYDIFAQRIDASGAIQWGPSGVAVSATTYNQNDCRLVHVGSGVSIAAWVDYRSGSSSDIYAQKIDAGGTCQWTSNGVVVCGATGDQLDVQLISNGLGGAVATWDDERSGGSDIYAQRIDTDGSSVWTADGSVVCTATANQTTPQLAPDEWGGASFTWKDERSGTADIYSQKIDAAGDIGTATLLQSYTAVPHGSDIKIEWTLSEAGEDVDFYILRASAPSFTFDEIASIGAHGDDMSFIYVDNTCMPGTTYLYRVDVRDGGERKILFETGPIHAPVTAPALDQNIPNPFNPSTTIRYYLPEKCRVILEVYGVSGELMKRLVDRCMTAGSYTAVWDGRDGNGRPASSGVYLYRLRAGKSLLSRKMVLIR